jgi:hypothetical protein
MGCLRNPRATKLEKNVPCGIIGLDFSIEEEVYFLALCIDCPFCPNTDYVAKLKDYWYDRNVLTSLILNWFKKMI